MRRVTGEPTESHGLTTLTELGRDGVERPSAAELDQGLAALLRRVAKLRAHRRRLVGWSLVGAATALCIAAGLYALPVGRQPQPGPELPALAYQIEGGSVLEGGYLREVGHDGIQLSFNEGSRVLFTPGTRGRLRAVGKEGAQVAIENGTASFDIVHSLQRRWSIEVGPFVVVVKGTVFSVSWDPLSEQFELRLRRGRVVVSGPATGGELSLRAGQRLVVNLAGGETLITDEKAETITNEVLGSASPQAAAAPASSTPPATMAPSRPSPAREKPVRPSPSVAPAPPDKKEGEHRWADDFASNRWDRILDDVQRAGVEATLERASSEDLFMLAHAARYQHRADLARSALLAVRRRFPGSPRTLDAIFLLGRVEESRERGQARAIAWYDEYLTRAPSGAFAAEALGRKMTLANEVGGPAEARPIAEEYLRRFPGGSYARLAHLLGQVP